MKSVVEAQPNLDLRQAMVDWLLIKERRIFGIETHIHERFLSKTVILTTGTFLRGLIHIGDKKIPAGRMGEKPAAHCIGGTGLDWALELGIGSVEHGYFMTDHQIERIAEIAHQVAGGVVTLLYDCDEQGDQGMDRDSVKFAKHCRVQRAWARDMHGGRFAQMQPEQLTMENGGKFLRDFLTRGVAKK